VRVYRETAKLEDQIGLQLHTGFACVLSGRAHRERESERAINLSVFIVKQPNLKFKSVCNYTPALHVFSVAIDS